MSGNWTPGPWVLSTETKGYEACTVHGVERQPTEDGVGKTWVYIRPETLIRNGEWYWPDAQEQLANAHLIAAAPELYAALEMAHLWLDVDGRFDMQGINAALAKARGEA